MTSSLLQRRYRLAWLLLLASITACPMMMPAQEDDPGGGPAVGPEQDEGSMDDPEGVDLPTDSADAEFFSDLSSLGDDIPVSALEIFPEPVRRDIRDLISELLPLLQEDSEEALDDFFDQKGAQIATVFDQLGLQQNASALLALENGDFAFVAPAAAGGNGTIKFPDEFEDYAAYLDSLELEPFEREYMLRSHQIAEEYQDNLFQALGNGAPVQSALETYQLRLEALNEKYAEQFRERFLDGIDRTEADGRRPGIDR